MNERVTDMRYKDDTSEMIKAQLERMEAGERKLRMERESAVMAFMRSLEKAFPFRLLKSKDAPSQGYIYIKETVLNDSRASTRDISNKDAEYERTKQMLTDRVVNRYIQGMYKGEQDQMRFDEFVESIKTESVNTYTDYYNEDIER